jgi:hypothetical protein
MRATHLFHQPIWFELVAVGQATHQRSFPLLVHPYESTFCLWPTERLSIQPGAIVAVLRLFASIRIRPGAPITSTLLVCLAIEQEVAKNTTWAPEETICPALDTALVLIKDKYRARGDHLTLCINEPTSDTRNESTTSSLENEKRVACSLYPTRPRRLSPSRILRGRLHCGHAAHQTRNIVGVVRM